MGIRALLAIALVGCGSAAETEGPAPVGADAMAVDDQVDAGGVVDVADADVSPDALPDPAFCPNFDVYDDGTEQGQPDVVISRIWPGHSIELFNRTDQDVHLVELEPMRWFSYPQNRPVADDVVVVPALGCAPIPFPTSTPTHARGELALVGPDHTNPTSILDYVCWGDGPAHTVIQATARDGGKWEGGCAPAVPAGRSLVRMVSSLGNRPADYVIDNL